MIWNRSWNSTGGMSRANLDGVAWRRKEMRGIEKEKGGGEREKEKESA